VKKMTIVAAILAASSSAVAVAQEGATTDELQLTLPGGKVFLDAFLEVNLSKDFAFKPVSIAPDIWYGVSDDLTLGLIHSSRGATGLFGGSGDGLCLTGKTKGCPHVYDNIGLDARYHLVRQGILTLAADGGLYAMTFDPFKLDLKLGAIARLQSGAFSFELGPNIFIGLNKRSAGNKEVLAVPATFMYAVVPKVGIAAQFGLLVPFADTSLTMFGGSLGVQYFATDKLMLDAVFSLPALAGGSKVADGMDMRTFTLGVGYAF
jgi:opacity protein-like surface antigen